MSTLFSLRHSLVFPIYSFSFLSLSPFIHYFFLFMSFLWLNEFLLSLYSMPEVYFSFLSLSAILLYFPFTRFPSSKSIYSLFFLSISFPWPIQFLVSLCLLFFFLSSILLSLPFTGFLSSPSISWHPNSYDPSPISFLLSVIPFLAFSPSLSVTSRLLALLPDIQLSSYSHSISHPIRRDQSILPYLFFSSFHIFTQIFSFFSFDTFYLSVSHSISRVTLLFPALSRSLPPYLSVIRDWERSYIVLALCDPQQRLLCNFVRGSFRPLALNNFPSLVVLDYLHLFYLFTCVLCLLVLLLLWLAIVIRMTKEMIEIDR